jgi:hypothetical protein
VGDRKSYLSCLLVENSLLIDPDHKGLKLIFNPTSVIDTVPKTWRFLFLTWDSGKIHEISDSSSLLKTLLDYLKNNTF